MSMVSKTHAIPTPIILSGTKIVSGEGFFLVIVVGNDSCAGKIRAKLTGNEDEDENTPLQEKLEDLATDISIFGVIGAAITVGCLTILWLIKIIANSFEDDAGKKSYRPWGAWVGDLLHYFIIGVAVIIMAVPEGLPLAVTLSLAFSVKKMLQDQNLVRKLYACETMGGANCICSDKTGTLTMNEMHLVKIWNAGAGGIEIFQQKEVCKPQPPFLTPRRPLRHGKGQQRLHDRQRDLSHAPPALDRVQLQRQHW